MFPDFNPENKPRVGESRVEYGFVIYKKLNNKTKWFQWATWLERYTLKGWKPVYWLED